MANSRAPSSNVQERRIEVIGQMVSFVRVEDQLPTPQQQPQFHAQYPYPPASTSSANLSSQNIRMPSHSTSYMQPFMRGPSPISRTSVPFNQQRINYNYRNPMILSNPLIYPQYPLQYQQANSLNQINEPIQNHDLYQEMVNVPTHNQSRQRQANTGERYLRDNAPVTAVNSQFKFDSLVKTTNSTPVSYEGNTIQMSQSSFPNLDSKISMKDIFICNQDISQARNLKQQSTSTQTGASAGKFIKKEEDSEMKQSINLTKPTKTKLAPNTVDEEAVEAKKIKHEDEHFDSDYISRDKN